MVGGCKNNPEKPSTTNVGEYIPSGFSMSTIIQYHHLRAWVKIA